MKCDGVNVCELFLLLYLPWYCCCCWRCFGRCCAASATGGTLLDSMVCVYFVVFTTTCCFTTDKLYEIVNVSHYFSSSKTKKKNNSYLPLQAQRIPHLTIKLPAWNWAYVASARFLLLMVCCWSIGLSVPPTMKLQTLVKKFIEVVGIVVIVPPSPDF